MSTRDRYTINLKCPICGKVGVAQVSEFDRPSIYSGIGFSVNDLPEGFYVSKAGTSAMEMSISCSTCNAVADE